MKSIYVSLVLALSFSFQGMAKDLEKEFHKTIEHYDVPSEVRNLEGTSAEGFWNVLLKNDMSFRKFNLDIEKGKGAEKEALKNVSLLPRFNAEFVDWIDVSAQGYCDSICNRLGLYGAAPDFRLYISDLQRPYSCSALSDKSFAVIIDKGLLASPGFCDGMLIGIIAHEFTHGLLRHRLHNEYDLAKSKRRKRLTDGLLMGVVGAASIAAIATLAPSHDYTVYEDNSINITNVNSDQNFIKKVTPYNYLFSKDQVLQADLVAYRLLEHMGYDGRDYIGLLKLLENGNSIPGTDTAYEPEDDLQNYPSLRYRILFLEYVAAHPEIGNTVNDKLRESLVEKQLNKRKAKAFVG